MNQHRKLIFDKFYQWVSDNSETLPIEVTDVAAEIWNLEEECEFWKIQSYRFKNSLKENQRIAGTV
jgi:TfoX/Sxy family transcriptional regulator of competence genes